MTKLYFTQDNMPSSSEEFRALLAEAIAKSNPIDDLLETAEDLAKFEKQYQMPSSEFYQKFHAGQLGDELDYFEWSHIYRVYVDLRRAIESALLRSAVQLNADTPHEVEAEAIPVPVPA